MPEQQGMPPVQPDVAQALRFFGSLYPAGGIVHFRAVPEPADGRTPTNHHYVLDKHFPTRLADFLAYCAVAKRAAFFLPGTVRVGATGKDGVLSLPAVLVDLDKGDPQASLAAAEALLGPATITVASGGTTPSGSPKLHAYWVLEEPAKEADIDAACRVRETLATRFEGDPAFKQPAQIIRIPGSIHFKGTPKLVQLRSITDRRYALAKVSSVLGVPTQATPNWFDFSGDTPAASGTLDRALTAPVRAEGKDGITRFEAAGSALGHFVRMIREGRMTEAEAWQAARNWNIAMLVPPWPEDRLRTDFDRLLEIDRRTHGPIAPPPEEAAKEWRSRFDSWTAAAYQGVPAPRPWLIDGVLPLGIPGMIAARGGVGKSFLVADLALRVATGAPLPAGVLDFNEHLILGGRVVAYGTAVVFLAEDDRITVHERLAVLDPGGRRFATPQRLRPIPLPDAGGARPFLRSMARGGGTETTPEFEEVRTWLRSLPDLRLVVFDPLQAFVAADITASPEAGQAVCNALSALASETGAAVLVTHHVKKTDRPIGSAEALRDAIRGTTALVDGLRWVYGLWESETEGRDDAACATGAVVKANLSTCRREHHYRRASAGVLRQVPPTVVPNQYTQQLEALEKAIIAAAAEGRPFTHFGKSNGLYAERHRLPGPLKKMAKAPLEKLGKALLDAGKIVKGTARGRQVREWLDGPEGAFGLGHGVLLSGAGGAAA